jgi:hypothetical protein
MDTTRILLIDDLRDFRDARDCVVARTSAEALEILKLAEAFDEIWFDHDLGLLNNGVPDTTMVVVDFLSELAYNDTPYPVGVVYVHTSNPVGGSQITSSLTNYGYTVRRVYAGDVFISS